MVLLLILIFLVFDVVQFVIFLNNVILTFQARPVEYVESLLAHQTPVSFHKHYEIDPMDVYKQYLS